MTIIILGSGCPNCITLENNAKKAVLELNLKDIQVLHEHDILKITEYGVMSTPAIVIDGQVQASGRVPDVEEIKKMITGQQQGDTVPTNDDCSCGGNC